MLTLLPDSFMIIDKDVWKHYKEDRTYVNFRKNKDIHQELRSLFHNEGSFIRIWGNVKSYVEFPFVVNNIDASLLKFIREGIISRLGTLIEIISEESIITSYLTDFLYEIVINDFKKLKDYNIDLIPFSKKSIDSIIDLDSMVKSGDTVYYSLNLEIPSSNLPEPQESIGKIEILKHHLLLLDRLGIINYLEDNWKVVDNQPLRVAQADFARLLAKIMGYSEFEPIRRALNKLLKPDKYSDLPFKTDKAVQAIDNLLHQLKIEPSS